MRYSHHDLSIGMYAAEYVDINDIFHKKNQQEKLAVAAGSNSVVQNTVNSKSDTSYPE